MKWIKLEEKQPPKEGPYLVVKADKKLKPEPSDVRIWEWRDLGPQWNFTTFWANQEEVDDLGGWPTHWAYIQMHGL
jgi:hypothetical protein